ncbi:hypothetical protein [Paracoccus sp. S1E-3]|uniref:hypothetical protein n=1 Tax=Paracoccus sp. S1E-3 TaxID=2756130 RepID=UPI0021065FCC|nr:hypothetical protein [Paracoccus sp. S1E-3]
MNAVEIEQAVTDLAEKPFDADEFPFAFLEAFGNPTTTISNCIYQVAGAAHFWRFLHSAFAMVTSFLATAVMMTLCGLPALRRRSAKCLSVGL